MGHLIWFHDLHRGVGYQPRDVAGEVLPVVVVDVQGPEVGPPLLP
jgi:hypothetical protein